MKTQDKFMIKNEKCKLVLKQLKKTTKFKNKLIQIKEKIIKNTIEEKILMRKNSNQIVFYFEHHKYGVYSGGVGVGRRMKKKQLQQ